MQPSYKEISITILTSTSLMVIVIIVIILASIRYQNKVWRKHTHEINELTAQYQQELLKSQLEIREQTLNYISQEIHDNIGQVLSLAKLTINSVKPDDFDHSEQKILTAKDLVGKAIQDLRNLSKTLNTDYISQLKLSESLRIELDIIQRTGSCQTELQVSGIEMNLEPQKLLIIFRIAQEVLNNIIKHAQAHNIRINLDYSANAFAMEISDDGIGFNASESGFQNFREKGTGLNNMLYRAKLIGGDFVIESQVQAGTSVLLKLPF